LLNVQRKNQLTPPTQLKHIYVRNEDTSATANHHKKITFAADNAADNKQHQQQFIRDDSMRLSIMAGWVYSVARAMRVVGGCANRAAVYDTARDCNSAKSDLQTPPPICRSSQNVVKMPVDDGVLISPRGNWLLQASQNLSRLVVRMIVAWKEQRVFRGEGGVVGNEPGRRFAPSGRRWPIAMAILPLFGAIVIQNAVAQVRSIPSLCLEKRANGQYAYECTNPIDKKYYKDLTYLNSQGEIVTEYPVGDSYSDAANKYVALANTKELEAVARAIALTGKKPGYRQIKYDSGSCVEAQEGLHTAPGDYRPLGFTLIQYYLASNPTCKFSGTLFREDGTQEEFPNAEGAMGVGILCAKDTALNGSNNNIHGRAAPPFKCIRPVEKPCKEKECTQFGNPISARTGNKTQTESSLDVVANLKPFVEMQYSYPGTNINAQVGFYWQQRYFRALVVQDIEAGITTARVTVKRQSTATVFQKNAQGWLPDADINDQLAELKDAQGLRTGWQYYDADTENNERYNLAGKLVSTQSRGGATHTLSYNAQGQLLLVTDDFGRSVAFTYYDASAAIGANNIATITDAAGQTVRYEYDSTNNLAKVTYPNATSKTYLYGELSNTSNAYQPNALTGIVDENGIRYATFKYNSSGQAVSTEHTGAVDKYNFSYSGYGSTTVTDPLGTARTYSFSNVVGNQRLTATKQPCVGSTCGTATSNSTATTHDTNGNITSRTDFNNNKMCYTYDLTRNLETGRIEGLTSSADCATSFAAATLTAPARKITTTWHPTYRLPATITEPVTGGSKTTTHTYDTNGNLTQRVVTTPQATRTWLWSGYDAYGRATTMTDPRGKITTYAYYPNTAAQNTTLANSRGMLASITNALGHVTTITSYNAHGQPLAMTDANGLTTTMTYDARLRLKSRSVSGTGISETTSYDYDGVGQLIKVTLPDASFITYTYDGAHRLTQIQDGGVANTGNKIVYTLDAMGNRTAEQAYDPAGLLARSRTRVYDALNRLKQDIGATTPATQISQYGYDNQGNGTTTTDPLSRVTTHAFDALNRLVQVTDPTNSTTAPTAGITQYAYDVQDNLTKVTDPKFSPQGAAAPSTTYSYNGFNELISQSSPDTGTTTYTYDAAGNMLTKTDARDKVAKYVYDNLNRVTQIKYYPTTANANANTSADETVTYTYDTGCGNTISSKGRLCSLSDKSGTTTYSYDLLGRTIAKSQAVASLTQSHTMRYNAAGQMDQLTTASGQVIGYGYTNNRVTSISVNGTALIGSITYDPFGPAVAWLWPSATTAGLKTYRDYDLDGRMIRWELKNGVSYIQRDVVWDNASRVTNLKDLLTPAQANNQGFGYDALDRLTTTKLGTATTPSQTLTYDAIGNRTSATINGIISTYNLPATSHKLTSTVGGSNPRAFTYDAMGNLTSDGKYTYTYLNNGRLNKVTWVTGTTTNTATYDINALGQRVRKVTPASVVGTRRFMYDEAGRLTGEYDSAGKLIQETIWMGDIPIATLRPKAGSTTTPIQIDTFYVHADHLNTPRVITRPSDNKVVWSWENTEAFGNNLPNENPSALGTFTYNLRMPGQQFDKETNTFYNYFRDFDPSLGRYVQSDPIGLKGGPNTYAYVFSNPLALVDPFGLQSCPIPTCTPGKLAWIVKCVENAQDSAKWRLTGCSYLPEQAKRICIAATIAEFYIKRAICTSRYPECRDQYTVGLGG
jgi:RHS repeat-associated protein